MRNHFSQTDELEKINKRLSACVSKLTASKTVRKELVAVINELIDFKLDAVKSDLKY